MSYNTINVMIYFFVNLIVFLDSSNQEILSLWFGIYIPGKLCVYVYDFFCPQNQRDVKTLIFLHSISHGLRTPNEGMNQRYLKIWADLADKICFGHT